VELRVLGTMEVTVDGGLRVLGGQRQRGVLADLALNAGRVVVMSQLIDDLWAGSPPASAAHTVETYVSRLRRVLSTEDRPSVLGKGASGYVLNVGPEQVDALHFGVLADKGRAAFQRADAVAAKGFLSGALALWRGAALADVRDSAFAPVVAQRLETERLALFESLMDVRLSLGEHRELVSELERAVALDPYRERLHAQLMLALYRSGRQAAALAAFQHARARLADDLGIEPGRELRELERGILLQAPELDAPPSGPRRVALQAKPPSPDKQARGRRAMRRGRRAMRRGRRPFLDLVRALGPPPSGAWWPPVARRHWPSLPRPGCQCCPEARRRSERPPSEPAI